MSIKSDVIVVGIAAIAVLAAAWYLKKKAEEALSFAGDAAAGALDGVSNLLGIPTTKETLTNDAECKAYMDQNGIWMASGKCAMPAFLRTVEFNIPWMPADTEPRRSTPMFDRQL